MKRECRHAAKQVGHETRILLRHGGQPDRAPGALETAGAGHRHAAAGGRRAGAAAVQRRLVRRQGRAAGHGCRHGALAEWPAGHLAGQSARGQQQKAERAAAAIAEQPECWPRAPSPRSRRRRRPRARRRWRRPARPTAWCKGGLQVDTNSLTAGWLNAQAPVQTPGRRQDRRDGRADGRQGHPELGKRLTSARTRPCSSSSRMDWAVLNRVNDPLARPSQIQGQIKADGTVMIVNRNGIVFTGSSQVDTRNLVAAAVGIERRQFKSGMYGKAQGTGAVPTFANDLLLDQNTYAWQGRGRCRVAAGARIDTRKPQTVTEGGGYVLLAGRRGAQCGRHHHAEWPGRCWPPATASSSARAWARTATSCRPRAATKSTMLRAAGSTAGKVVNTRPDPGARRRHHAERDATCARTACCWRAPRVNARHHPPERRRASDAGVTLGRGSVTRHRDRGRRRPRRWTVQRDALLKDPAATGTDTPSGPARPVAHAHRQRRHGGVRGRLADPGHGRPGRWSMRPAAATWRATPPSTSPAPSA